MAQPRLFGGNVNECLFCQVVRKEIESYSVFEDDTSIAFLDTKPLFPGHLLLIPKEHYATITDVPQTLIDNLFNNTKMLVEAIEMGLKVDGTFIAINNKVSQSVPHLHIHIVPRRLKDGLKGFFWPRNKYKSREEMLEFQKIIKNAITSKD